MTAGRVEVPCVPVLTLSAATLTALALGTAGMLTAQTPSAIPCAFSALSGVGCPFCGLTHGVAAIGAGNLDAALVANPLAPLACVLAVVLPAVHARRRSVEVSAPLLWVLAAIVAITWLGRLS